MPAGWAAAIKGALNKSVGDTVAFKGHKGGWQIKPGLPNYGKGSLRDVLDQAYDGEIKVLNPGEIGTGEMASNIGAVTLKNLLMRGAGPALIATGVALGLKSEPAKANRLRRLVDGISPNAKKALAVGGLGVGAGVGGTILNKRKEKTMKKTALIDDIMLSGKRLWKHMADSKGPLRRRLNALDHAGSGDGMIRGNLKAVLERAIKSPADASQVPSLLKKYITGSYSESNKRYLLDKITSGVLGGAGIGAAGVAAALGGNALTGAALGQGNITSNRMSNAQIEALREKTAGVLDTIGSGLSTIKSRMAKDFTSAVGKDPSISTMIRVLKERNYDIPELVAAGAIPAGVAGLVGVGALGIGAASLGGGAMRVGDAIRGVVGKGLARKMKPLATANPMALRKGRIAGAGALAGLAGGVGLAKLQDRKKTADWKQGLNTLVLGGIAESSPNLATAARRLQGLVGEGKVSGPAATMMMGLMRNREAKQILGAGIAGGTLAGGLGGAAIASKFSKRMSGLLQASAAKTSKGIADAKKSTVKARGVMEAAQGLAAKRRSKILALKAGGVAAGGIGLGALAGHSMAKKREKTAGALDNLASSAAQAAAWKGIGNWRNAFPNGSPSLAQVTDILKARNVDASDIALGSGALGAGAVAMAGVTGGIADTIFKGMARRRKAILDKKILKGVAAGGLVTGLGAGATSGLVAGSLLAKKNEKTASGFFNAIINDSREV